MPRKERSGRSSLPSAVWLKTTSRMTSMPLRCSSLTRVLSSSTCMPQLAGGGVAGLRGEEADGAVAPVVEQQLAVCGLGRLFSNSSNSKMGISSTQLTPSSFRYGIFSRMPAKVPGSSTPGRRGGA